MSQTKSFDIEQLAYLSDEAFVHHCFVRAFRRACNPSQAKHYLAALANGTSRGKVVRSIFQEDEYRHRIDTAALRKLPLLDGELFLHKAYGLILGRPIDNSGLETYSKRLAKGDSKLWILYDIATSAEGQARWAQHPELNDFVDFLTREYNPRGHIGLYDILRVMALNDDEFVQKAYRFTLRREADAVGLAAYQQALRNGISKIRVLYSLAYSDEGQCFKKTLLAQLFLTFGRFV
jgi:hypothetical protein